MTSVILNKNISRCVTCSQFVVAFDGLDKFRGKTFHTLGYCDEPKSEHYGHLLTEVHPICALELARRDYQKGQK